MRKLQFFYVVYVEYEVSVLALLCIVAVAAAIEIARGALPTAKAKKRRIQRTLHRGTSHPPTR